MILIFDLLCLLSVFPGHMPCKYLLFPAKSLSNNENFKPVIVLKEKTLESNQLSGLCCFKVLCY